MKNILLTLITTLALTTNAHAWKETGGGDEVGLDFQQALKRSLRELAIRPMNGLSLDEIEAATERASIIAVEHDLTVNTGKFTQESVATNEPVTGIIQVNRARWNAIGSEKMKEAIALHEVLSLAGKESTGHYQYSSLYLENLGAPPGDLKGINIYYYADLANAVAKEFFSKEEYSSTIDPKLLPRVSRLIRENTEIWNLLVPIKALRKTDCVSVCTSEELYRLTNDVYKISDHTGFDRIGRGLQARILENSQELLAILPTINEHECGGICTKEQAKYWNDYWDAQFSKPGAIVLKGIKKKRR